MARSAWRRVRALRDRLAAPTLSDVPKRSGSLDLSGFGEARRAAILRELELLDPRDRRVVEQALPYTMTGVPRVAALVDGVRHVLRRDIPGAFLECGVWRGGSVLAMVLTLLDAGVRDRDVFLYDTFTGMTEPGEHDTSRFHPPARETWVAAERDGRRAWEDLFGATRFGEATVRDTLLATGYPAERVHVVAGDVMETVPDHAPERIALLRLDTDWYESTRHELEHLYPRLVEGGVLVIDDFGEWEGARRAVEEYFASAASPLLLHRIDHTGRIAVKA